MVGDVGDSSTRKAQRRSSDDVGNDGLADETSEIQNRSVEHGWHRFLSKIEIRLIIVQSKCRSDRKVRTQVSHRSENQPVDQGSRTGRCAGLWSEIHPRVDGRNGGWFGKDEGEDRK